MALPTLSGCDFIRDASSCLNLALNDLMEDYRGIISFVHSIMMKLRTLIASAKVQKSTNLRRVLTILRDGVQR